MSFGLCLAVAAGGAAGAPARYLTDRAVSGRIESDLPWGTFVINVAGSLVLGVLTGLALHHHVSLVVTALLGVGFCGAFTTLSTFTYETVRMAETGEWLEAAMNIGMSLGAGLLAAAGGLALGLAL
ncbi:MAG: fluoride efflux transporter CrcB [Acidimicrobiales bacterium]|jgi:CrcB protein